MEELGPLGPVVMHVREGSTLVPGRMWMSPGIRARHEATGYEGSISPGKARDGLNSDVSCVATWIAEVDEPSRDAGSGDASAGHGVSCSRSLSRS